MTLKQFPNQNFKYFIDFGILPNLGDAPGEMMAFPKTKC